MTSQADAEGSRPKNAGLAALISREPLIVYALPWHSPLGLAEGLGERCRARPVTFLLPIVWHCNEKSAQAKAVAAREFAAKHPMHTVIFLGNTPSEIELLSAAGCTAFFSSQNVFVSERDFRPLPGVEVEFDAVYNARPVPEKRHELAAEIERVVYICGVTSVAEPPEARRIVADLLALGPKHIIVNDMADGLPGWLDRQAVNNALARAAVGLCLTAVEGAMYASVEYLLAGLPIVSTPSLGGREIFFDPDYCLIVEANPRAIREAVSALRRRDIPRQYVRERTLARLEPERQRFMAFVEDIKAQHGVPRAYETEWNYPEGLQLRWRRVEDHAGDFFGRDEAGRR